MLGLVSKRFLSNKEELMCPECSKVHFLPIDGGKSLGVQGFPNNLAIENLLKSIDTATGNLNSTCDIICIF